MRSTGHVCLRQEIRPRRGPGDRAGRPGHDVRAGDRRRHPARGRGARVIGPLRPGLPGHGGHDRARRRRGGGRLRRGAGPRWGSTPGTPRFAEAQAVVRDDHGVVQGRRLRRTVRPRRGRPGHRAFAAAYEAIVAAGEVGEDPGRPPGLRTLRARGVRGLPDDRVRPVDPRRTAPGLGLGAARSTWPSPRPTSAGAARRPTWSSGPWTGWASTTRRPWPWSGDTVSDLEAGTRGRGRCRDRRPQRGPRRGHARPRPRTPPSSPT